MEWRYAELKLLLYYWVKSGQIRVDNRKITSMERKDLDDYRNQYVGIIFQFNNLIPQISAYENIAIPLYNSKMKKKEVSKRVMSMLEMIGLESRRNHTLRELSGGEQQKIAFAIALSPNPRIVLMDEPTGELDNLSRSEIYQLIKNISEQNPNTAFIIVTHDLSMTQIADKVFNINDGKIEQISTKIEIKEHANQKGFLKSGQLLEINTKFKQLNHIIKQIEENLNNLIQ